MSSQQSFRHDSESLNEIEIQDDELSELLERLAATDAIFQTPVTKVKDVAELTEAPPALIARILAEIRGIKDAGEIQRRLDEHAERLKIAESRLNRLETPNTINPPPKLTPKVQHPLWDATVPIPKEPATKSTSKETDEIWQRYKRRLDSEVYEEQNNNLSRIIIILIATAIVLIFFVASWVDPPSSSKNIPPLPNQGRLTR
jgi:hypothetical protein